MREIDARLGPALDDLVRDGLEAALGGESPAVVAQLLWEQVDPTERADLADTLAPRGLTEYIQDAIEKYNGRVGREPRGLATSERRAPAFLSWSGVLAGNYEAADGTRKALSAFDMTDCRYLAEMSRQQANGKLRLADAMDLAASLLRDGQTIAELPKPKRASVEAALTI